MLSRRHFLKLSGSALTAAASATFSSPILRAAGAGPAQGSAPVPEPVLSPQTVPELGRVTMLGVDVHTQPTSASKLVRKARRDEVLPILGQVNGETLFKHNSVWYQTPEGYVYSSIVQPVKKIPNKPLPELAKQTFWGEITVPISGARWSADANAKPSNKLYFGSVFRVIDAEQAADGAWWYRLGAGVSHGNGPWIPAEHLRRFDPVADLSPLSPDVENKRIEINLAEQSLTAFEDDKPVLMTIVATGKGKNFTPRGSYRVWRKAIGQRMIGGEGNDFYDLPGVPFPTYFTYRGIAFHGAYWHNDFGVVRSHGCINMQSDLARWIWRWTTPTMQPSAADVRFGSIGTPVKVV